MLGPCLEEICPLYAICKDISNERRPKTECKCVGEFMMNSDKSACLCKYVDNIVTKKVKK